MKLVIKEPAQLLVKVKYFKYSTFCTGWIFELCITFKWSFFFRWFLWKSIYFKHFVYRISYRYIVYMYSTQVRKKNILIYSNTNYSIEMKLVSIIMDYCLLQFDALKFFLGGRLHGGSQPNFNFFNVNTQIFRRFRKVHLKNCLEKKFHKNSNVRLTL